MWTLLLPMALAQTSDADVIASRTLPASREVLMSAVQDLTVVRDIYPDDCLARWVMGEQTSGVGASATVTYSPALMHRRLTMTLIQATDDHIRFDHPGNRGFYTQWDFETTDAGTVVTIHTYLNGPPKPFGHY